jgi:hypothetical protein
MAKQESRLYPKNKKIASVFVSLPSESLGRARARLPQGTDNEPRRRMIQTGEPYAVFEFGTPPNQISFEGMAAEYTELPRPLMNPAVDVKNSRSYRVSFEFLVAHVESINGGKLIDGMFVPVHAQLKTLELMANRPVPVRFENFDPMMTGNTWYISEMTFNAVRYNTAGEITSCQVSINLISFQQQTSRFVSMPKISYRPAAKKDSSSTDKKNLPSTEITIDELARLQVAAQTNMHMAQRLFEIKAGISSGRITVVAPGE